jgi:hypothetical protein
MTPVLTCPSSFFTAPIFSYQPMNRIQFSRAGVLVVTPLRVEISPASLPLFLLL